MINQENTPAGSFPELSQAVQAAIEFVNTELGGVDGRPIELEVCNTEFTAEGSTSCGQQFVEAERAGRARRHRRVRQRASTRSPTTRSPTSAASRSAPSRCRPRTRSSGAAAPGARRSPSPSTPPKELDAKKVVDRLRRVRLDHRQRRVRPARCSSATASRPSSCRTRSSPPTSARPSTPRQRATPTRSSCWPPTPAARPASTAITTLGTGRPDVLRRRVRRADDHRSVDPAQDRRRDLQRRGPGLEDVTRTRPGLRRSTAQSSRSTATGSTRSAPARSRSGRS